MRWKGRRVSSNIEDRRGGAGRKMGASVFFGFAVAFVAWKFFGVDPQPGVSSHAKSDTASFSRYGNQSIWIIQRQSNKKLWILLELYWQIPKTLGIWCFNSN